MSYLLDTNVISELCKNKSKINSGVLQWISQTSAYTLFTSVLVIGELSQGVLRLRRRDSAQADIIQFRLDQLALYTRNTLVIDLPIVARWAELNTPDPKPVVDSLLAATALVHELTIVTRNVSDFEATGVAIFNPFVE